MRVAKEVAAADEVQVVLGETAVMAAETSQATAHDPCLIGACRGVRH